MVRSLIEKLGNEEERFLSLEWGRTAAGEGLRVRHVEHGR